MKHDEAIDKQQAWTRGRILVVEDEPDVLQILKERLEHNRYQVSEASNGLDALRILKKENFDLVILDIMLPEMDGLTTLREIRKRENCRDLPVVVLTAKQEDKIGDLFALEGISAFVEKPFVPSKLLSIIDTALGQPGQN